MKLETLQRLWQEKNPDGNVWYAAKDGSFSSAPVGNGKTFAVTFCAEGKIYQYKASSIHALAERFDLIPGSNLDYMAEARKAIDAMDRGQAFASVCDLADTIVTLVGGAMVDVAWREIERDEYDRARYEFSGYTVYPTYEAWAER